MMDVLVCIVQLTAVMMLAALVSRWVSHAAPALAAHVSWLGITLGALTLVASFVNIPRLYEVEAFRALREYPASAGPQTGSSKSESRAGVQGTSAIEPQVGKKADASNFSPSLSIPWGQLLEITGNGPSRSRVPTLGPYLLLAIVLIPGLLLFAYRIVAWRFLSLLRATSVSTHDPRLASLLQSIGNSSHDSADARLQLTRIKFFESKAIDAPCVSWLDPNVIYLPDNFGSWSRQEQVTGIAHELAHQLRMDAGWRCWAEWSLCLIAFHPCAHWLRKQLVFNQELATDRLAAKLVGDREQYQLGLSRLALRMDQQQRLRFRFGVSVSTSHVVRRIKLMSIQKRPWSKLKERTVLGLFLFLAAGTTVWQAKAEDSTQLASHRKAAATDYFQHSKIAPWEKLGTQSGYAMIRPQALRKHQLYRGMISDWLDSVAGEDRSGVLSDYGVAVDNIAMIAANLQPSVEVIPAKKRKESDKKFNGTVKADAMILRTEEPIDWPGLGDELIPEGGLLGKKFDDWIREQFNKQGKSNEMNFVSESSQGLDVEGAELIQAMFQRVDGGVIAAAFAVPHENLEDIREVIEEEDDPYECVPVFAATEFFAVGVDLKGETQQRLQMVLVPTSGSDVEELSGRLEHCRKKLVGSVRLFAKMSGAISDDSKPEILNELATDLERATIEFDEEGGAEAVCVRITLNADLEALVSDE